MGKILGFKLRNNKAGRLYATRRIGKKVFSVYVATEDQAKERILKYCAKKGVKLKDDGSFFISKINGSSDTSYTNKDNVSKSISNVCTSVSNDVCKVSNGVCIAERLEKIEAENLYLRLEIDKLKKVVEARPPISDLAQGKPKKKTEPKQQRKNPAGSER